MVFFKILNLYPADFGAYKHILLSIFLAITFASFYLVPDFLGVRALAGLALLIASLLLDAAYMQDPASRLFLVSFVYLVILLALILEEPLTCFVMPLTGFLKNQFRVKLFAYVLCLYGALLGYVALNY